MIIFTSLFKNLRNVPEEIHNIQFSVCVAEDAVIIMIEVTNEWVTKHVHIQSSRIACKTELSNLKNIFKDVIILTRGKPLLH